MSADAISNNTVGRMRFPSAPNLKKYSAAVASAGAQSRTRRPLSGSIDCLLVVYRTQCQGRGRQGGGCGECVSQQAQYGQTHTWEGTPREALPAPGW